MAVGLLPVGNDAPFVDSSGNPLSGGLMYFYVGGSDTLQDTFTTSVGNVANANPVVLNSNGYPAASGNVVGIWGTLGVDYKAVLKTSAGVTVWTRDHLPVTNDTSVTIDQWVSGPAPTYISATSFSVVGDQTGDFTAGRRVKTTNTGGTVYSRIISSAFASVTTVTVVNDSSTLDSGLSAVSLGLITAVNTSAPVQTDATFLVSGSSDATKLVRFEVDGITTGTIRTITIPNASGTLAYTTTSRTRQVLTSGTAATYTTPAGCTSINVRCIGPGGGGAAQDTNAGANGSAATTFSGGTMSAGAGIGGAVGGTGALGGASSGGDINITGAAGGPGYGGGSAISASGGSGGPGPFGGNGAGGTNNTAGTNASTNSGGGGGGAGGSAGNGGGAGGGSGGYCERLITSPAATYTYTIGTGGAGGAAGGRAGGNGGAGLIVVDEFYA